MWQNWALIYIGVWLTYSGLLFGKPVKWHNIFMGIIIIILTAWAGIKARKLRHKGGNL
jgi:hypothetical protein